MQSTKRTKPNILVTGTPGTGKTTLSENLAQTLGMNHIEVGKIVKEKELHDGWDEEFQSWLLNEDKVCDELEDTMTAGGNIVDHHGCDFFPERWFDLVVVLRTENSILYPRLEKRGYAANKITENIEAEIMQVVLDEAQDSYKEDIVIELRSESLADMEANTEKIANWVAQWSQ